MQSAAVGTQNKDVTLDSCDAGQALKAKAAAPVSNGTSGGGSRGDRQRGDNVEAAYDRLARHAIAVWVRVRVSSFGTEFHRW